MDTRTTAGMSRKEGFNGAVTIAAAWIIRRRGLLSLFAIILVILAIPGLRLLEFSSDYRVFFGPDNPELVAFEAIEKIYTKNDNVLLALEPANGDVFTRESLTAIHEFTERSWRLPHAIRVNSLTNFQHTKGSEEGLEVYDLVQDPYSLTDEQLPEIRSIALAEPLLIDYLVSSRGDVSGINITFSVSDDTKSQDFAEIMSASRELVSEFEQRYPSIQFYMTGNIAMNYAFLEESRGDIQSIVPISFLVMFILLAYLSGGFMGSGSTLLVVAGSVLAGMGLGGYLGMPISPPSSLSPIIILTVAVANCVHILCSYNEYRLDGEDQGSSIIHSLRVNIVPVSIASLTTAIGFLSMNFSDAPPFGHLGNFVAMGVGAAWILSLTVLPLILSLTTGHARAHGRWFNVNMEALADSVIRRRRSYFFILASIAFILICFIPANDINDNYLYYFDDSVKFRADSDFISHRLTGMYTAEYHLDSKTEGGINDPDFMHDVARFTDFLRSQPETVHVHSLSDIVKRLNKNLHEDSNEYYKIPDTQEEVAQFLLLYEMSLPYGLDLNNQINVDKSSALIFVKMRLLTSQEVIDFNEQAIQWIHDHASAIKSPVGSGASLMFAHIGQRNIISMLVGTLVALLLVSLLLVCVLRSVKFGVLSLAPNLAPAAMGFGLWGIAVGEVGLSLSVVAVMSMGIVIDDTVHFLFKYLRARRELFLPAEDAVRFAFKTVGRALLITSITLSCGFFILALSNFELNSGMGLLTGIVIILALVADFFLLPPLIIKVDRS